MTKPAASRVVAETVFRDGLARAGERQIAEEAAIALSYDGSTEAVMMASPADFTDFAIGFSLSEGIIESPADIEAIDVVEASGGFDIQIRLVGDRGSALGKRRRAKAGPVGCGLCGVESIEEALKPAADVSGTDLTLSAGDIANAVATLADGQPLNHATRATHAAGFYVPGRGMVAIREDVGRHNALDKLAGALARAGIDGASGAIIMTSRLSVELVQKTARIGSPVLVAISAPTGMAIDMAKRAGMTLVALARGNDHEIFSGPERVTSKTEPTARLKAV